ncbi:MAG: hypothetical protein A2096_09305 [Spirochaetes bacterium GWF1_41_5]|nr:MAG: hypothetical protein A2096_09305 [Spirochaetes bacterium GWF1_41_5]HBE02159.1 isoprenylcysteine carboxyl methyltransferase [Spirochaetia bacterium]
MKKITFTAIIKMLIFVVLFPFLPIIISHKYFWIEAWTCGLISVLSFAISRIIIAKKNPDLIAERAKFMQHQDAKPWDKILAPLVGFGGVIIPVTAGLDAFYSYNVLFSLSVKIIALAVFLLGMIFSSYAVIQNRFFSGMVRIQTDRGHKVVSVGPYRIIRHPGYAGALITYWVSPLIFDSYWTFLPVAFMTVILVIRTCLEDKTLVQELDGYKEYTLETKYRLIPGLW